MQAIILAGGMGKRLRPLTQELPKPMISLLNKPLMEYSIELLKKYGINDIGVTLMFLPQYIKNYFKDGSELNVKLTYYTETTPLGTAGSVKLAEEQLDDTFIVLSGDALSNIDLEKILKYHNSINADVTIILSKQNYPLEYGVVLTDSSGKVTSFVEKPNWESVVSNTVNTGIYVINKNVLNKIPINKEFDFSKDLFPLLLKENYNIYGYITEDYWCDLGNPEAYLSASIDYLNGKVNSQKYENVLCENVILSENTKLVPPVFIGKNTILNGNNIIGPNVVIGENNIIENVNMSDSVLWDNVLINKCDFSQTIIGSDSKVLNCVLAGKNVIGSNVIIKDNSHLKHGIKVNNNTTISENAIVDGIFRQHNNDLWNDNGIFGIWNHQLFPKHFLGIASSFQSKKIIICSNNTPLANSLADMLSSYYCLCGTTVYICVSNEASCRFFSYINKINAIYIFEDKEKISVQLIDDKGLNISRQKEKNIDFDKISFSLERGKIIRLKSIDKDFEYFLNASMPFCKENVQISADEKYRLHNIFWEGSDFNGSINNISIAALKSKNNIITDIFNKQGRLSVEAFLRLKCDILSFLGCKNVFLPVYTPNEIIVDVKNRGMNIFRLMQHRGDSMQQATSFVDLEILIEYVPAFFAQALAFYLSKNDMPKNSNTIISKYDFNVNPLNTCKTIFALNKDKNGDTITAKYKSGVITILPQNNGYYFSAYGKFAKEEYSPDLIEEFISTTLNKI